jgi:hypothetical protein
MRDFHNEIFFPKQFTYTNLSNYKMGLFGDKNTENIVVSQNAANSQIGNLNVNLPFWEMVIVAIVVSILIFALCTCLKKENKWTF